MDTRGKKKVIAVGKNSASRLVNSSAALLKEKISVQGPIVAPVSKGEKKFLSNMQERLR